MRLTIPQPQLLKHLQIVERAVNDRSTLPILANVLIETTDNELTLTATDLDVGIQCRFPLTPPVERGAVALPARRLTSIVRELSVEGVVLEAKKNATATLSCGSSSFRIPGLPAEDFPVLPPPEPAEAVVLPQGVLKMLLSSTAHAMSMEETRFILNGALLSTKPLAAPGLQTEKRSLTVVATDGRRLAIACAPVNELPEEPFQVVIPAKTVRELSRLLQEDAEDVTMTPLRDNQLAVRFGGVTIMTRLIEGQFPQFDKVIPAPSKERLTCNRQGLMDAIRRASLMTTATSQAVIFELAQDRLTISKESAEHGSAREELSVAYAGEAMAIAFNPEFWLDVLRVLDVEEVAVEISGAERPAVIRQAGFLYLALPMKIS